MAEKFQALCEDDINNLMKVLEKKFPRSLPIYNWLRVHQSWKGKIPEMTVELLSPRGDWRSGSVAALCRGLILEDMIDLVTFADSDHVDEMAEALKDTCLIPWSQIAVVPEVVVPLYQPMKDILNIKIKKNCLQQHCHVFWLDKEKAAALQVNNPKEDGIRIGPLEEKHLDTVLKLWYYNAECFSPMTRAIILNNLTVGVFIGDKLVSMAVEAERGGVGMVVTDPDYLNRGYAKIAFTHMIRAMGQAGINVHSTVAKENTPSIKLHKDVGLEITDIESGFFRYKHRVGYPTEQNVRVGPLEEKHLETVLKLWYFNADCFLPMTKAVILNNLTIGVFIGEKLVSMAVEAERGGISYVVTDPDYLKRGYQKIVFNHIIRAMGQAGINVHSTVAKDNIPSVKLHEKFLGMTDIESGFFRYKHRVG